MTEEDFERLAAPMRQEAKPIFERFLMTNSLAAGKKLGRYPRLRGDRSNADGSFTWIEFGMGVDAAGRYFTRFDEQLPHELAGGVWYDEVEPHQRIRYYQTTAAYEARPYRISIASLAEDLQALWVQIGSWSRPEAMAGMKAVIPRRV